MMTGERLKALRKDRNLTQSQLARMLHVQQSSVSAWENGSAKPDFENQRKLAEIYEITIDELFNGTGLSNGNSKFATQFKNLRKAKGLTQSEIASCLRLRPSIVSAWESGVSMPDGEKLIELSKIFRVPAGALLGDDDIPDVVRIPVLGRVHAGIPASAIEEVLDYEEIPNSLARRGEYFGLVVRGDSMAPRILDGDTVIVRVQDDIENGEIAVVAVNGDSATIKKVRKSKNGITLIPLNTSYDMITYTNEQVKSLNVKLPRRRSR